MTFAQYKSCRIMRESVIGTQLTMKVPQKQSLPRCDWVGWSQLWGFKQNKSLGFSVESTMAWPRSGPLKTSKSRYLCDNVALVSISDTEWHHPKAVADWTDQTLDLSKVNFYIKTHHFDPSNFCFLHSLPPSLLLPSSFLLSSWNYRDGQDL